MRVKERGNVLWPMMVAFVLLVAITVPPIIFVVNNPTQYKCINGEMYYLKGDVWVTTSGTQKCVPK